MNCKSIYKKSHFRGRIIDKSMFRHICWAKTVLWTRNACFLQVYWIYRQHQSVHFLPLVFSTAYVLIRKLANKNCVMIEIISSLFKCLWRNIFSGPYFWSSAESQWHGKKSNLNIKQKSRYNLIIWLLAQLQIGKKGIEAIAKRYDTDYKTGDICSTICE